MCSFFKKKTYAFSDILKGLQHAINSAQSMLQAQQVEHLSNFWQQDGNPVTQRVVLGDKEVKVPLLTLVPHSQMAMDNVEIKFKTRIGDIAPYCSQDMFSADNSLRRADLQVEMQGVKASDDDTMEISIRFKVKETPEGVSRLMDEYNKQI